MSVLPRKNVRIVSDGIATGTKLFAGDDDLTERLSIKRISWSVEAASIAIAEVEIGLMRTDIAGEARYFMVIAGERKEVRRIEFADGTELVAEH